MTAVAIPRSTALTEAGREFSIPLTEAEARELTAEIRVSVQELLPKIRTAYQRRADLALGYASWEAYCDAELSGLRMSVADRPEAIAGLRAEGMSQRAIGAALGVSQSTVRNDLAQLSSSTQLPERITGTDGKERPASRPPKPDLAPDVERALASYGAAGATAWQVAFLLDARQPSEGRVEQALHQLAAAGRALVVGQAEGGALWALAELVDAETPGPVGAADSPPADPGTTPAPAADAPAPSREPVPGLADRVWQVLDQHGNPPYGLTIPEMWVKLPGVHSADIPAALAELAETGRAVIMGHADGQAPIEQRQRWLTRKTAEVERIAAVAEVAPEFVKPVEPESASKPTLTLVPAADEVRAAEQRDARALLRRAVDLLAPASWDAGHVEAWIEHMGPYDDELAELTKRAATAIAVLDRVIEEAGR